MPDARPADRYHQGYCSCPAAVTFLNTGISLALSRRKYTENSPTRIFQPALFPVLKNGPPVYARQDADSVAACNIIASCIAQSLWNVGDRCGYMSSENPDADPNPLSVGNSIFRVKQRSKAGLELPVPSARTCREI